MKPLEEVCLLINQLSDWSYRFVLFKDSTILGVMETVEDNIDEWVAERVAAQDGYGPWLYIEAMNYHGNLAPCQEDGKVSEEDSSVWEYFYNEGEHDVDFMEMSPHSNKWLRIRYYKRIECPYEEELQEAIKRSERVEAVELTEIDKKAEEYLDRRLREVYG